MEYQVGRTVIGTELRSFMWNIKDFDSLQKGYRTTMKVEPHLEYLPSLKFSFFLEKSGSDYCVEIILDEPGRIVSVHCNLSIVDNESKDIVSSEYKHRFEYSRCNQYWRFPLFITKNKILENRHIYLVENTLFLRLNCTISVGVVSSEVKTLLTNLDKETCTCSNKPKYNKQCMTDTEFLDPSKDFMSEIRCSMFERYDFKLYVGSKRFHVHKSILSARSPVFKSIFMNDSRSSRIVDVDKDTMQRMLLYIYTDVVEQMDWEASCKLYSGAVLYGLEPLKLRCSSILKSSVRISNVLELLLMADTHQDKDLTEVVKDFIAVNSRDILTRHSGNFSKRNILNYP